MILPYMLIIFNRLLWSLLFPIVLLQEHRTAHEFCPEALFTVFDTFIALGTRGDPSAFITEEFPLPRFGGRLHAYLSLPALFVFVFSMLFSRGRSFFRCFSSLRLFSSSFFSTEGLRLLEGRVSRLGEVSLESLESVRDGVSFL